MIEVLLIGGPVDGHRQRLTEYHPYIRVAEAMDCSVLKWDEIELEEAARMEFTTHTYRVMDILADCWIGVHDRMTTREAIAAMVRRYPQPLEP